MKRLMVIFLSFLMVVSAGCGAASEDASYKVYSVASKQYELRSISFQPSSEEPDQFVKEMTEALANIDILAADTDSLLSDGVAILGTSMTGKVLNVDLNKAFLKLDTSKQVMVRAGLTKSFAQIDGITKVKFFVNGSPLKDSAGRVIVAMTPDMFLDVSKDSLYNYVSENMTLYYFDQDMKSLKKETREVFHALNVSKEQAVLNELIKGPQDASLKQCLPYDTNVLSVIISNDICYVNFDESVNNSVFDADPELSIEAIVDSIYSVCGIQKVKFAINGADDIPYRDTVELDREFSPDVTITEE